MAAAAAGCGLHFGPDDVARLAADDAIARASANLALEPNDERY